MSNTCPAFNLSTLPHRELKSARTGEAFSLSAVLTDAFGFKDLFVHHEIIPPGRRAAHPHSHSHREEMILVLEGEPTAHEGDVVTVLKPGDFLGFRPGTDLLHFVENHTTLPARVLVIASSNARDQVLR